MRGAGYKAARPGQAALTVPWASARALALTLVALVAVTVAAIGIGVYAFVDASLRDRLVADARQQVDYNLAVLLPGRGPAADRRSQRSRRAACPTRSRCAGSGRVIADFGDGARTSPADLARRAWRQVSPELRAIVASGQLGLRVADARRARRCSSSAAGRAARRTCTSCSGPSRSRARSRSSRVGLIAAGAAADRRRAARRRDHRPLAPPAGRRGRRATARRIAAGDLAARVPERGRDEVGRWAADFNRMADSLEATVARLEAVPAARTGRFVADVAHELRTPLTALVAEASLIEGRTSTPLPPDARRAAELLVADVRRLRVLVDDLMEVSRFDADAERPTLEPVDLGRVVTGRRRRAAARGRGARCPPRRWSSTPTRGGWTGSSATCSTTPATTRRARRSRSR